MAIQAGTGEAAFYRRGARRRQIVRADHIVLGTRHPGEGHHYHDTEAQRGEAASQSGTAILAVRTGGTPVPRSPRGPRGFWGAVIQPGQVGRSAGRQRRVPHLPTCPSACRPMYRSPHLPTCPSAYLPACPPAPDCCATYWKTCTRRLKESTTNTRSLESINKPAGNWNSPKPEPFCPKK